MTFFTAEDNRGCLPSPGPLLVMEVVGRVDLGVFYMYERFSLLLNNHQRPGNATCMGCCIGLEEDPLVIFVDEFSVVSEDGEVDTDMRVDRWLLAWFLDL